ncbi:MAG TPA: cyclic pyranopterin monophosphate synthase MoaC, partial [Candidatus Scatomorpha intestinavium]|nr:cyclic pyranopterin monophosphate synthase MoaC [Candidatus Scatomorpha intestinavium]
MGFTHIDERGNAVMVDVGGKDVTARRAVAEGRIRMSRECFELVKAGRMKKGDVLGVAQVAGIMAAKKAAELIPLCHTLLLTNVKVELEPLDEES